MLEGDWREVKVKRKRSNVECQKVQVGCRAKCDPSTSRSRSRSHLASTATQEEGARLPAEVNTCRYSPSRPVHEKLSMVWASGRHMGKGGIHVPILPL